MERKENNFSQITKKDDLIWPNLPIKTQNLIRVAPPDQQPTLSH